MKSYICIAGIEEKLLYTTYGYIKELDLKSGEIKVLLTVAGNYIYSLAYDYDERYLYIPRMNGDIIKYSFDRNEIYSFIAYVVD